MRLRWPRRWTFSTWMGAGAGEGDQPCLFPQAPTGPGPHPGGQAWPEHRLHSR